MERNIAHGYPATAENGFRPDVRDASFIRCVAGAVVHHRRGNSHSFCRIPYGDVGIGSDNERTFFRIETVQLRGCCAGQIDEAFEAESALSYRCVEQKRQADFKTGKSVGDLLESRIWSGAQFSSFIKSIRRMIG